MLLNLPSTSGRGTVCAALSRAPSRHSHFTAKRSRPVKLVVRAQEKQESDEDFEARLAALKLAKGQTPMGQGKKKETAAAVKAAKKAEYDYTDEKLHLELAPSYGNLALNVALGITLVWLPLTFAVIGQTAFVKYRFTDKRISVITNAPWKQEQLDAAYQEVRNVVAIGRGVGLWGDMVVELRSGDKIEMRAVPQWKELRDYIIERAKALKQDEPSSDGSASVRGAARSSTKGFA